MRVPEEVTMKIAEFGERALKNEATNADIGNDGAVWLQHHQPDFALELLADWTRKRTKFWIHQQTRDALRDSDSHEQLPLPFPELGPYLEVRPGRLAHHESLCDPRRGAWR